MLQLLNYRLKITLKDGRVFIGQMLAFDRFMNLVLSDCEEFRTITTTSSSQHTPPSSNTNKKTKTEVEEKRTLGLVILRGEHVLSMSIEAPPPSSDKKRRFAATSAPNPAMMMAQPGIGLGRPAGRPVMPPMAAPVGLSGPVAGVGGPDPRMMRPPVPGMFPPGMRPPMGMPGMFPPGMRPPPGRPPM